MDQKLIARGCLITFSIFILLVATVLPVTAHWDPPEPPPINVSVWLESIEFNQNLDDWWDADADLYVFWFVTHEGHTGICCPPGVGSHLQNDYNFDDKGLIWSPRLDGGTKIMMYGQYECTPKEEIAVFFRIAERDADPKVAEAALWMGVYSLATIPCPALSAGFGVLAAILGGISLNGEDKVGYAQDIVTKEEEDIQTTGWTIGGEGGSKARIMYRVVVTESECTGCCDEETGDVPPPDYGPYGPKDRTAVETAFTHWRDSLTLASQIEAETGSELKPEQIQEDRETLTNAILDVTDGITAAFISSIETEPDPYSEALQYLSDARALRNISIEQAMNNYEMVAMVVIDTLIALYPEGGVGGIVEFPQIEEPGAAIPDSSGHNYGASAGIIAGAIAGVTALISAAWYIRRRRTKAT